jgi:hypothetical protein
MFLDVFFLLVSLHSSLFKNTFIKVLVYMEEHITVHAQELFTAIYKNFTDSDISIEMKQAAVLCGRYVTPETYISMLLPRVKLDDDVGGAQTSTARCNALQLLFILMKESKPSFISPLFPQIVDAMVTDEIILSIDNTLK